ncbi:MAG: putative protein serine/threonine kinase [Streblomastix strix]|uniref:non-specific serine/threonine protein kinase n=1 Tax=Streblomastix strix TaxID=222440 RepID=A0A5J4W195_9EUKA|nr:MAG: putative protein serine/threonine kinase [Streblomastix strix]
MNTSTSRSTFQVGDVIKDSYTLAKLIGAGTFGSIFCSFYRSENGTRLVAVKLERNIEQYPMLYNEVVVLKALTGNKHFARFYQYGTHKDYKFIAMELLGSNMIDLVNRKRPYKFSLHSVLKFGIQAIESLQALHQAGFVHRDIKPGNFVIGNSRSTTGTFFLIDFGLCKRLNIKDGVVVNPVKKGNFRGTMMYASLNAHYKNELGRNDDLMR